MKKTFIYVTTLALLAASCSKSDSIKNIPVEKKQTSAYLKFSGADDFFAEINKVSKMDDQQYANWKKEKQLSKTLFDRYLEVEKKVQSVESEQDKQRSLLQDTSYFYYKDDQLFSKNGIILDKLLNVNGVVMVGNVVIRYQNKQMYYVINPNQEIINTMNLSDVSGVEIETMLKNKTTPRAADHTVSHTFGQSGTYLYNLKGQRFDFSNRRHFVNLYEQYIMVPTADNSTAITYKLYFEFGQHKKVLFSWNTYPSKTYCQSINVESHPDFNGAVNLGGFIAPAGLFNTFSDRPYQGTILNQFSYPINPPNHLFNVNSSFETVNATHPTYDVFNGNSSFRSNSFGDPSSSVTLLTARIKLNATVKAFDTDNRTIYYDYKVD